MNHGDSGKNVTLKRISADERNRWDALVEASPHGTVFHKWPWVNAMAKHSWYRLLGETIKPEFHPLIAEQEGRDIGLIPLYVFRGRFLTYVLSPPPHTEVSYLGPCITFPNNLKQSGRERMQRSFHNAIEGYLIGLGAHCVRIRTPPGYDDMRPYLWMGYNVTPLFNYVIDLRHPVNEIFENCRKDFRKRARRAEEDGYVVIEGSFADVETLYNSQSNRYKEKGLRMNITLEYLKDLWEGLGEGRLMIFKTEKNGEYASAAIRTCYRGKITGWMGSHKNPQLGGSPNDLLHWTIVKWAIAKGYTEHENIWANEESLNHFKTKLNPNLNRFYSVVRMNRALMFIYEIKKFLYGGKIWGADL
jgi:hypothetical protein